MPFLSTLLLLNAIKLSILFFIGVTWVGATVGIGTGILTLVAAPAVIVGAAVVGGVWGINQLVAGYEINDWIDYNFGYR